MSYILHLVISNQDRKLCILYTKRRDLITQNLRGILMDVAYKGLYCAFGPRCIRAQTPWYLTENQKQTSEAPRKWRGCSLEATRAYHRPLRCASCMIMIGSDPILLFSDSCSIESRFLSLLTFDSSPYQVLGSPNVRCWRW